MSAERPTGIQTTAVVTGSFLSGEFLPHLDSETVAAIQFRVIFMLGK